MAVSLQRLGDNPRDHDGTFKGFSEDIGGVSGVRPDAYAQLQSKENGGTRHPALKEDQRQFEPWTIYPKPPPPHWHWKAKNPQPNSPPVSNAVDVPMPVSDEGEGDGFEFDKCEIPGKHEWVYRMDSKGVFQVYRADSAEGEGVHHNSSLGPVLMLIIDEKPVFAVPTIRDYYVDLDYVLGVIADGPTKTFAYRRLKYLQGKWGMYSLLHEHAELDQMKVTET
jgi:AMP deaminase